MNIIFSDGSHKKIKGRQIDTICGCGLVVRIPSEKKEVERSIPLPESTNNYAELYAIYEGLEIIKKHSSIKKEPLVIISDSKYAIQVITDTMILAGKKGTDYKWLTKQGTELANQKLLKKIYKIIVDDEGDIYKNIKFIHMNSHLNSSSKNDIKLVVHNFKLAGFDLSDKAAIKVIELNDRADRLAKKAADSLLSK